MKSQIMLSDFHKRNSNSKLTATLTLHCGRNHWLHCCTSVRTVDEIFTVAQNRGRSLSSPQRVCSLVCAERSLDGCQQKVLVCGVLLAVVAEVRGSFMFYWRLLCFFNFYHLWTVNMLVDFEKLRMSGAGKAIAVLTSGGDAQGS